MTVSAMKADVDRKTARKYTQAGKGPEELQTPHTMINAPAQTTVEEPAALQGGRHFVERTFEDGKSHVGMGDYQMRKWLGWQHHMALVGLAMLFVMEERLLAEKTAPLLSVRDVVELMDWYFLKHPSLEELQAVMSRRHQKRKTVMEGKMQSRSGFIT